MYDRIMNCQLPDVKLPVLAMVLYVTAGAAGFTVAPLNGIRLLASWNEWHARPICFRLLVDCVRAAASRTFWTAGTSKAIRIAMIAMTTSNSISVNPALRGRVSKHFFDMTRPPKSREEKR